MNDCIYRVMPEVAPGVFRSRATGGSPGFEYRLGEWTPRVANPVNCKSGYHTLTPAGLSEYIFEGDAIVRCKRRGCGEVIDGKAANESVMPVEIVGRATKRNLRLFAAACAEDALPHYKAAYPDDLTLEVAIHTVRAYSYGAATDEELAAARNAAWAAWDAARAARNAAWAAWDAAWDARNAAWDARNAAWAAWDRLGRVLLALCKEETA